MINEKEFDKAHELANDVIDFVDGENTKMIAFSLLMAATTYLVHGGVETGEAARMLRILMKIKQEDQQDGPTH